MSGLVPFNRNRSDMRASGLDDFYNMLDNFFEDSWLPARNLAADTFKLDVQEKEKEYSIEAELPGVKKEEIKLEMNDERLTISIERNEDIEEKNKNYIHKERRTCSMQRNIYLRNATAEGIKAKLDNGVLSITIPKTEDKENKRKINIE